jgi:hypothetical protein
LLRYFSAIASNPIASRTDNQSQVHFVVNKAQGNTDSTSYPIDNKEAAGQDMAELYDMKKGSDSLGDYNKKVYRECSIKTLYNTSRILIVQDYFSAGRKDKRHGVANERNCLYGIS